MNKHQISTVVGVVLLLGFAGWYKSQSETVPTSDTTQQSITVSVELSLNGRTLSPEEVSVFQGQEVTVHVTSDEQGEFHIAGYEHLFLLTEGKATTFTFEALRQGRFSLEFHPRLSESDSHDHDHESGTQEDIPIGTLVVNPK
jgi:hypothetical protein